MEAWLDPGQTVQLGDVELFVENTEVNVAIPKFERPRPKPPVILPDGAMVCPRHPQEQATYRCTICREVMCGSCVHIMRIKGGQPLFLCLLCSHKCEPLEVGEPPKKKKGFSELLRTRSNCDSGTRPGSDPAENRLAGFKKPPTIFSSAQSKPDARSCTESA